MGSSILLSNGKRMPVVGLGTWQTEGEDAGRAVEAAIDAGYRHIDTAFMYKNEKEIGEALKKAFKAAKVKREDMFITTKLPLNGNRKDNVKYFFNKSLASLQLDYIDLYLIHGPITTKRSDDDHEAFPLKDGKLQTEIVDLVETWKVMEELVDEGLALAIGLSNFNSEQIKRIYQNARIKPACLQVECHPYFPQIKLHEFCKSLNIPFVAYAPLGSPGFSEFAKKFADSDYIELDLPKLLLDPVIVEIAKTRRRTPAQILLRYLIERGMAVIPKSSSSTRIRENINVFDFKLTSQDMKAISKLSKGLRIFRFDSFEGVSEHPENPFTIEF